MGILNYQNQNYEAAEKYYNSILSTDSDNSEAHFGKGSSLFMQNDIKNAEIKFNESLASSETLLKSKAFYNLGNISYKNKKLNDALEFYKKALELNPSDDEARYNYEFIKYQKDPEEKKDEEKKDDEKKDEEKKDEEKKDEEKKDEEKKDDEKKNEEKKDEEKKDEEKKDEDKSNEEKKDEENDDNSQSQQKPLDEKKSQDLKKAESILDALKNDEKVMQKQQLQRFKTKKLLKDW
ncbi:MAG: tetratricopeptide repeat protein [Candidatus Thalassarchaeaceae archaeon]